MTDLVLENINFSYPGHPVLQEVTCRFQTGKLHVILGPNGSGKTTLLDILSGYSKPDSGSVRLGSIPLKNFSKRELARQLSLVSQDYAISFPFSVREVVLMGRHPFIDRFSRPTESDQLLVQKTMDLTGISHMEHSKITELSGGEKQRCVFARALCQDTPFLLLDEAFANMDVRHTLDLLRLLKRLVKDENKTVIAVLHDLNLAAQWADTILMLKNGRILFHGVTDTVFTEEAIKSVFEVDVNISFNTFTQSKQAFFQA